MFFMVHWKTVNNKNGITKSIKFHATQAMEHDFVQV